MKNTISIILGVEIPILKKNKSSDEQKRFFTKWSEDLWIWHLYNVFRSANPIQIQPINPNSLNNRKCSNKSWYYFNFRVMFFTYVCILPWWICKPLHRCSHSSKVQPTTPSYSSRQSIGGKMKYMIHGT